MNSGRNENPARDYSLFGLRLRSSLELPELVPATGEADPDVIVDEGRVSNSSDVEASLVRAGDALVLTIPDVGRYLIRDANRITIDSDPGVPERNVRLFLLGSAMGALLHQRGMLPLHANAVEVGGKVVAFMGASGEGKSTLAVWFHDRGHRIITDDVCVVSVEDEAGPRVWPGLPRLRLWREALEASGRDAADYARSYVSDSTYDKFDMPVASEGTTETAWPLAAVYLLGRGEQFAIERLGGVAAAEALMANTYRGQFTRAAGTVVPHWLACVTLAGETPVFGVSRRWGRDHLETQLGKLLDHVAAITGQV